MTRKFVFASAQEYESKLIQLLSGSLCDCSEYDELVEEYIDFKDEYRNQ